MSYKSTDKCIEKAFDDEMLFVLMARDETAPDVILHWISLNMNKQPPEKLLEAFNCAVEMKKSRARILVKKNPRPMRLDFEQKGFHVKIEQQIAESPPLKFWKTIVDDYYGPISSIITEPLSEPTKFRITHKCSGAPCVSILIVDPVLETVTELEDDRE